MNFDERYHSNRIKYFVKNCSQLIEDARRYQSGEKTCHGNRPKEVRDLMLKVENYLKADPFESKTVKQIILDLANLPSNPTEWTPHQRCFARHFLKDPTKQNLSENTQHEHLLSRGLEHEKLNADGKGSVRLHEGELLRDVKKNKIKGKKTKSLDGQIGNTYTIQKHPTGNGGGQDNQHNDAEEGLHQAIKYCQKYPNAKENFAIILDGDYYTTKRVSDLENQIPAHMRGRIRITTSDEI